MIDSLTIVIVTYNPNYNVLNECLNSIDNNFKFIARIANDMLLPNDLLYKLTNRLEKNKSLHLLGNLVSNEWNNKNKVEFNLIDIMT